MFNGSKKPESLHFEYNTRQAIQYGHSFDFDVYVIYSNGKSKKISGRDELRVVSEGASWEKGRLRVPGYPSEPMSDTIWLSASYEQNDIILKDSIQIPFNYLGDLSLDFRGDTGEKGEEGAKGSTPLLFSNGSDGGAGETGNTGFNGQDLSIYIWKNQAADLYHIKVVVLSSQFTYYYTFRKTGFGFKLTVNGGKGGPGGDGGDGGDGKDGKEKNGKKKDPGDGGNGGNGGTGGNGGNGGAVYVFLHPSAADFGDIIAVYNFGGEPGEGGEGGKAGKGGKPLEGQQAGSDGAPGGKGSPGQHGNPGTVLDIQVLEFDPDY